MEEITITMTLRTVDKKIKVLELLISENGLKHGCVSNIEISGMTDDELTDIIEKLQHLDLLKLQNTDLVSMPNESSQNEIAVYYTNIATEKIKGLLKKMMDKYPKLKEPLIRERPLRKIAKLFSNLDTKDEIIALLKRCAVPKILIESQHMQAEMIFRILNHYVWSAKKEDYEILTKIMGEFVCPIMFDGNKKEAQGMESMLNGLLEDDGFMIENGKFQGIKNPSKKTKLQLEKLTLKKIPIKTVRLDKIDCMLIINKEKVASFKSQSKQFKLFAYLWEFHWKIKNNKVIQEGEFSTAENLRRYCNFPSIEALRKQKTRINNLFDKKGIAIKIDSENNKYRLVIYTT